MKLNIAKAKQCLCNGLFSQYSEAYAITNENLRDAIKYIPENANVLTVAASGDHPLFCSLKEPKFIDCFDVSYNAKLVTDIKTAAVHTLNYDEYVDLIYNLYRFGDLVGLESISKIMQKLSKDERKYLKEMQKEAIFNNGCNPLYNAFALPTLEEYAQMQKLVNKPFNFIWSDITNLQAHLTKKYDFIHLSNIFDYIQRSRIGNILLPLMKRSNTGCVIYFMSYAGKVDGYPEICHTNGYRLNQKWEFKEEIDDIIVRATMRRVR